MIYWRDCTKESREEVGEILSNAYASCKRYASRKTRDSRDQVENRAVMDAIEAAMLLLGLDIKSTVDKG